METLTRLLNRAHIESPFMASISATVQSIAHACWPVQMHK